MHPYALDTQTFVWLVVFETQSLCVALAGLKLNLWTRLALNS